MNTITPEVAGVLNRSKIEPNKVFLPDGLSRPLYMAVNKHIENCEGKWDKKQKCHFFINGTQKLVEGMATGKTTSDKKELGAFFTPQSLAERVVELADIEGKEVLEPSAGEGALVKECLKFNPYYIACVEIFSPYAIRLRSNVGGNAKVTVLEQDFLGVKPSSFDHNRFDRVVMNPPYLRNTWVKHIVHAFSFLKEGGKLVSIIPNNRTNTQLMKFLKGKDYTFYDVEDGAFKETGTNISVCILEVNNR